MSSVYHEDEFELTEPQENEELPDWTHEKDEATLLSKENASINEVDVHHSQSKAQSATLWGIVVLQTWFIGTQFLWLVLSVVVIPSQVHHICIWFMIWFYWLYILLLVMVIISFAYLLHALCTLNFWYW